MRRDIAAGTQRPIAQSGGSAPQRWISGTGPEEKKKKKSYKYFERVASSKMPKKTNQDELVKAFGFLDKDGNGKVRLEDLKEILFCKGECMKESEINELLKKFTDRDGNINYNTLISSLLGQ